jgi:hypothetical protein
MTERQVTEPLAYLQHFVTETSLAITSEPVGAGNRMPQVSRNCAKANVDLVAARRLAISLSFNI